MVSTRSGRVVGAGATAASGTGNDFGATPQPKGARGKPAQAIAQGTAAADKAAGSPKGSIPAHGLESRGTDSHAAFAPDATHLDQHLPRFTERQVLLSPRRVASPPQPASPAQAAAVVSSVASAAAVITAAAAAAPLQPVSAALPAADQTSPAAVTAAAAASPATISPATTTSLTVGGWASGSGTVAQDLSAIPLPGSDSDEDDGSGGSDDATPAAAVPVEGGFSRSPASQQYSPHSPVPAPAHKSPARTRPPHPARGSSTATTAPRRRPVSTLTWLLLALLPVLGFVSIMTLCSPGFSEPLASILPPSTHHFIHSFPSFSTCTQLRPASEPFERHSSSAAALLRRQVSYLRSVAQDVVAKLRPAPPPTQEQVVAGAHHDQARALLQTIVPSLQPLGKADTEEDAASLAAAEAWEAAAADAAVRQKALGVLLMCDSPRHCSLAASHLLNSTAAASPSTAAAGPGTAASPSHCTASLSLPRADRALYRDTAGHVQQQLAELLSPLHQPPSAPAPALGGSSRAAAAAGCEGLLVVVEGLDDAPLAAVSVLSNALSESGNLQMDGVTLPTRRATFVFPVAVHSRATAIADMPAATAGDPAGAEAEVLQTDAGSADTEQEQEEEVDHQAWASGPAALEAFSRWGKQLLSKRHQAAWGVAGGSDAGEALRRALRRRIDVVLHAAQ